MMRHSYPRGGIMGRIGLRLFVIALLALLIVGTWGYLKMSQITSDSSADRIDRAGHTAAALFVAQNDAQFEIIFDGTGNMNALGLVQDRSTPSLSDRGAYDTLLADIGGLNDGTASLFRYNAQTRVFDPVATSLRRADGTFPAGLAMTSAHPAYGDLLNGHIHTGEVAVMGRLTLAQVIPVLAQDGSVAGALSVDVGHVDDLLIAPNTVFRQTLVFAAILLFLQAVFGVALLRRELVPIRMLARYAKDAAAQPRVGPVPFLDRTDDIGALATGLDRASALQDQLARVAYEDALTGLGNRSRSNLDLETALSGDGDGQWELWHLNLDRFSQLNTAYGQEACDAVLIAVAARLRSCVGPQARLARTGGSDFSIIIQRDAHHTPAALRKSILTALREPIDTPAGDIPISGSLGVVEDITDFENVKCLQLCANLALRKAQDDGGNRFELYTPQMSRTHHHLLALEAMLDTAMAEDSIELDFQPQVRLSSKSISGLEALARWTHPTLGPVPPETFISLAESSGQIVRLGNLILDKACRQAAKWRSDGFDFKHISVNVSPIQLWRTSFVETLDATLKKHGVPGECLCIEITESVFLDSSKTSITDILDRIRALGVMLSLDDFGTGYSSHGYLSRIPFDQLKIDRSFVKNIDICKRKQAILRGMLSVAQGLDLDIIIEGAETAAEVTMIHKLGGKEVQGFFFAKPVPAGDIPAIVAAIAKANVLTFPTRRARRR